MRFLLNRKTRPRIAARLSTAVLAVVSTIPGAATASPPENPRRTPWTTSRITGAPDAPPPYVVEPAFPKLRFDRPVLLAAAPGTSRLFVGELGGKVRSFPNDPGAEKADLAIDLAAQGRDFMMLFGMAFHPRFQENRHVFLCYTTKDGKPDGTRVSRFLVSRTDPPTIDPASEKVLITWLAGGHNGGCLQFGPDGYLYISAGDATEPSPPDRLETGQDLGDLLSSILRIDVDREDPGKAYRVPPDNPFVRLSSARPEIWAYGLRNPWRMSFDRQTGDLWVGDVGWELWELIYRVERGGNYGWSIKEGRQPVRPEGKRGPTPILPPIIDHPHSEAASITGGYVYRGERLKDLVGVYVYGDYQSGKLWGLRHDGKRVTWRGELADTGLRLVSFGEGLSGELYLIEMERTNQIYRLVPSPLAKAPREFPRTLSKTGLFASTKDHAPAAGVVPYAVNAQVWSDGEHAERLLAIPGEGRIDLDKEGAWNLPEGSVLARTVSLDLVEGDPGSRRRLETQVLHFEEGSWRPYSYAWDDAQNDATLVDPSGSSRTLTVRDDQAPGGRREQVHRFAARSECVLCHNPWVGSRDSVFGRQSASPLAVTAAQLDREDAPGGEGQLRKLERLGYFAQAPSKADRRLADPYDEKADLDARARAYLHVNCAHCHQANAGGTTTIVLSAPLELDQTRTIDVRPLQGGFGIDDPRIVVPGEPERSVLYYRAVKTGTGRMPRIGSQRVDVRGTRMIADWIGGMSRRPDAAPDEDRKARGSADLAILRDPSSPPTDRAESIGRLLGSTRQALTLVRTIDRDGVPGPALRQAATLAKGLPDVAIRDLFERFLPDAERVKRLGDAIDAEELLKLSGDPGRGKSWFFSESATQCKSCHRIGGEGTDLGPDLSAVGSKYARRDLLRQILDPSNEIDPKYIPRMVAAKDGQVHVGLLVERTDREVVLRDAQGKTIRVKLDDVEEEAAQPKSLMPEGLLRDLSAQQAADLLEYLSSLKKP